MTATKARISSRKTESFELILCVYANVTSQIQIARLINVPGFQFERVVFPGQRLLFKAMPNAQIEICRVMDGEIISDTITCNCLRVNEQSAITYSYIQIE